MCTSCSSWYEARNGTPHTFILRNLQLNKSMDLHVGSVFTQPQHVVIYTTSETKQNRTKLVWLVCYNNNYSLEQYIRRRQVSQSKSHSNCVTIRPTVVRQRISIRNCNISAWGVSWEMNTTRCPLDMHTEKPLAMALYPGQPWASPSSWCGKEQLCMQHLREVAYMYQCRDQTCFWHLNYLNLKSILTLYIELNEHWT